MTRLSHSNNLDLVRFALAMVVYFVHSRDLSGSDALAWVDVLSSKVAVDGFFVVSGFLIFRSYDASSSLLSYAEKRARRLYPAYLVVIMLCAFVLYFMSSTPQSYFGLPWIKYLAANLTFLNFLSPSLPGVFDKNLINAVNGALWSLKIEVTFYVAVPIIVWMFRAGRARVLLALYVASAIWVVWTQQLTANGFAYGTELGRQLPGALRYFVAGAAIYYWLPIFERHVKWLVPAAALSLLLFHGNWFELIVYPAALACVICVVSLYFYLGNFGRYGDFSYGLYVTHFPILQTLIALGLFAWNPVAAQLIGAGLSILAAVLMWHLVESRALKKRPAAHPATPPGS